MAENLAYHPQLIAIRAILVELLRNANSIDRVEDAAARFVAREVDSNGGVNLDETAEAALLAASIDVLRDIFAEARHANGAPDRQVFPAVSVD